MSRGGDDRGTTMRMMAAGVAALMVTVPALAAAPDARVMAAATAARVGQLALLERIVDIDSGTGDAAGANRIQAILADRFRAIGAKVAITPPEAPGLGDNLVATLTGTGTARILIIGHVDTVFGPGTVAERPFRSDGTRLTGPGVSDEKGGVVEAITALEILHRLNVRDYGTITMLVETSEEKGSPGTRALIDRLVRAHDVELNMEPGDAPDTITVWRKGSANIRLVAHGRAAHAGVDPENGRNAATELVRQLGLVDRFPHVGDGLTVNLTTLKAGDRNNVIPDLAAADVNVRIRTPGQLPPVLKAFEQGAAHPATPGVTVAVETTPAFPPLADNPATMALAARAQAIYAELGRTLGTGGNGGASESALAAKGGAAALDGLGPVGGGFHSVREYLELETLTPRLYLMTRLLMDLAAKPPARNPG